jgi:hypothetical protein
MLRAFIGAGSEQLADTKEGDSDGYRSNHGRGASLHKGLTCLHSYLILLVDLIDLFGT